MTFTSSVSSGTAYLPFNGIWTSSTTNAYSSQVGATSEYNYALTTFFTTNTLGTTIYGEWIQIYSAVAFKTNAIQIKSMPGADRVDPCNVYVFGSTNGTSWTQIANPTLSFTTGNTNFVTSITNATFYNYYRLLIRSIKRTGNSTLQYAIINELKFLGLYSSLQAINVDASLNTYFSPFGNGNVGIGTSSMSNKLQVHGDVSVIYDETIILREFPSAALTSNSTSLSGQTYGNGLYTVTATGQPATGYLAFNKDFTSTNAYLTSSTYTVTDGGRTNAAYNSATVSTTYKDLANATQTYNGDYVQIRLPNPIKLQSYTIEVDTSKPANYPYTFAMFGSNDGTAWNIVAPGNSGAYFSTQNIATFSVNSTVFYNFFRLSIYAKVGGTGDTYASVGELKLYGTIDAITTFQTKQDNVGLGTSTPGYQLTLSKDSAAKPSTTTWTVSSDQRLKENIELADLDICYDSIKNLPLKRYKYKDFIIEKAAIRDKTKLGWIAQDVEKVFPKATSVTNCYDIEDCKGLDADQLYAAMYGSIQKLMQKVETLENKVEASETKVSRLTEFINSISTDSLSGA